MCNQCITTFGVCGCTGGGVLVDCGTKWGVTCGACDHMPKKSASGKVEVDVDILLKILSPEILEQGRTAEQARAAGE